MASSLVRRGFRLSLSSSALISRRQSIVCSSPISTSSGSRFLEEKGPCFLRPSLPSPIRLFSSKVGADDNLKRVLESEILQAKADTAPPEKDLLPSGFPFEIVDNPGDQSITLKQEYAGETIQVAAYLDADEDDSDHSADEGENGTIQSSMSLVVTIDKRSDSLLQFCCTVNAEEIRIDSMVTKSRDGSDDKNVYEGPPFSDLEENLQNELYKYLEVRGINSSLFAVLEDYMANKDGREYLTWLKNMKEFIEA